LIERELIEGREGPNRPDSYPRKLRSEAQILAAMRWSVRQLCLGTISPARGRAIVAALETLHRLSPAQNEAQNDEQVFMEVSPKDELAFLERVKRREAMEAEYEAQHR
jgi:hypothetical protein